MMNFDHFLHCMHNLFADAVNGTMHLMHKARISKQDRAYVQACMRGDLQEVQHLLASPELKKHAKISIQVDHMDEAGLLHACYNGHTEVVRYLLTGADLLKHQDKHADLHVSNDYLLRHYCVEGRLEMVRFLLTSPEILKCQGSYANLHACGEEAILKACHNGHVELVKYLLTSPELPAHGHAYPNIHHHESQFSSGAFSLAYGKKHHEVVRFLVNDYNISITPQIAELMANDEGLKTMFENRELKKSLDNSLPQGQARKRAKI